MDYKSAYESVRMKMEYILSTWHWHIYKKKLNPNNSSRSKIFMGILSNRILSKHNMPHLFDMTNILGSLLG